MSYSIYIGEATPEVTEWGFDWSVDKVENENAPQWGGGDISENTNGRHPGYGQMADFCRDTGIYDVFFDEEDGLIREHPGIQHLTKEHHNSVRNALKEWQSDHPNTEPGWGDGKDFYLARLVWYEWWMKWALEHCNKPSVSNT